MCSPMTTSFGHFWSHRCLLTKSPLAFALAGSFGPAGPPVPKKPVTRPACYVASTTRRQDRWHLKGPWVESDVEISAEMGAQIWILLWGILETIDCPKVWPFCMGKIWENGDNPPDIGVQNFCTKTKFNYSHIIFTDWWCCACLHVHPHTLLFLYPRAVVPGLARMTAVVIECYSFFCLNLNSTAGLPTHPTAATLIIHMSQSLCKCIIRYWVHAKELIGATWDWSDPSPETLS